MMKSINHFRDRWLEDFFLYGKSPNIFPSSIEAALARKLDIINVASRFAFPARQYVRSAASASGGIFIHPG